MRGPAEGSYGVACGWRILRRCHEAAIPLPAGNAAGAAVEKRSVQIQCHLDKDDITIRISFIRCLPNI